MTRAALAFAAFTALACGSAAAQTVGPEYTTARGNWNSGGGITVYAYTYEQDGYVAICGAWSADGQAAGTAFLNDDVIDAGHVSLGGTRIVDGLDFMTELRGGQGVGGPANCVLTGAPWDPSYAAMPPEIRLPRMVFPAGSGGSQKYTFRQVGG